MKDKELIEVKNLANELFNCDRKDIDEGWFELKLLKLIETVRDETEKA